MPSLQSTKNSAVPQTLVKAGFEPKSSYSQVPVVNFEWGGKKYHAQGAAVNYAWDVYAPAGRSRRAPAYSYTTKSGLTDYEYSSRLRELASYEANEQLMKAVKNNNSTAAFQILGTHSHLIDLGNNEPNFFERLTHPNARAKFAEWLSSEKKRTPPKTSRKGDNFIERLLAKEHLSDFLDVSKTIGDTNFSAIRSHAEGLGESDGKNFFKRSILRMR